jgi:hypothetical protein
MANTYVKIASNTVGVLGAASIDFTSIPSTYTDLLLVVSARSLVVSVGDSTDIKFNNSSANFTRRTLYGSGSAASSFANSDNDLGAMPGSTATANTFSTEQYYIPNYTGSTFKSISVESIRENNTTAVDMLMVAGLWSQTSAINQITISAASANLAQYSTATLYGISKS